MTEAFLLGALDIVRAEEGSRDLIVIGRGKGKVMTGNAVYVSNPGSDKDGTFLSVVKEIQVASGTEWVKKDEAENCVMAIRIENGMNFRFRRTSVVYTREAKVGEVHDAYIAALGDAYVIKADLDISDKELDFLSLTDLCEIWRLDIWYHAEKLKDEPKEKKEENKKRLDKICAKAVERVLNEDAIYVVYDKLTGEPHLFSKTIKQDERFLATPPCIRCLTKAYKDIYASSYPADKLEIKEIANGEDKTGIKDFLEKAFYTIGALGLEVLSDKTAIGAPALVKAPDYSLLPVKDRPAAKPEIERWSLLARQMGEPQTDEQKTIYKLYMNLYAKAMNEAK